MRNWSRIDQVSTGWLITLRLRLVVSSDWFEIGLTFRFRSIYVFDRSYNIHWSPFNSPLSPLSLDFSLCVSPLCSLCVPLLFHRFMDQWSSGGKVTFLGLTNPRASWIERCLIQRLKMPLRHYLFLSHQEQSREYSRSLDVSMQVCVCVSHSGIRFYQLIEDGLSNWGKTALNCFCCNCLQHKLVSVSTGVKLKSG